MKVDMIPLDTIRPYENNPRKNDRAVDAVANSIQQYGFQQPIVVDINRVIVVGHTRYRAAKKLNLLQVPVVVAADLDHTQTQAYRIMDNRSNENAQWDDDLLLKEFEQLLTGSSIQNLSIDTGFSEAELNRLLAQQEDPVQEFNSEKQHTSRPGDLWQLGQHRLLNGDSTDPLQVQRLLQNDKIDLLWEDPPYGVNYQTVNGINFTAAENQQRNHKIANDNLAAAELDVFLDQHMAAVSDSIRPGSAVYWCHDIRFAHQFRMVLEKYNFHISDTLIWKKDRHSTFLSDYAKFYEPILYGWKKGQTHNWYGNTWNPNAIDLNRLEDMTQQQLIKLIRSIDTDYQEFSREKQDIAKLHPTVKPIKLIVYHLYNSTRINDVVYDGFAGAGSTLIAAEKTQRQARCIELESKFVDVIINRWQELTGQQAVREDGTLWNDIHIDTGDTHAGVDTNLTAVFELGNNHGS